MTITHAKVSTIDDGADTTLARPSDWNAAHVLAGEGARVYHDADQNISTATTTVLAFNTEKYDTDTIHDNVTNNSRLTCKTAGKYLIVANVAFAGHATGSRWVTIQFGGAIAMASDRRLAVTTFEPVLSVSTIYNLGVNEYVEVQVYQDSGGVLAVKAYGEISPQFMMQRIG